MSAYNTTRAVGYEVSQGTVDAVYIGGDISYATGYIGTVGQPLHWQLDKLKLFQTAQSRFNLLVSWHLPPIFSSLLFSWYEQPCGTSSLKWYRHSPPVRYSSLTWATMRATLPRALLSTMALTQVLASAILHPNFWAPPSNIAYLIKCLSSGQAVSAVWFLLPWCLSHTHPLSTNHGGHTISVLSTWWAWALNMTSA